MAAGVAAIAIIAAVVCWRCDGRLGPPGGGRLFVLAMPLVIFLASRLTGFMVENGGAIFALLILLCFGLFIARRMMSPDDRLLLVDPGDDGQYLVIMRYRLHGSATLVGEINAWRRPTAGMIRQRAAQSEATHLWTYAAHPEVTGALDVPLADGASYLLARRPAGWSVIRTWAHPGTTGAARGTGQ